MIILLHGQNSVASRNRLAQMKAQSESEVVEVEAKDLTPEKMSQLTASDSLFAQNRTIVIWQDDQLAVSNIKKLQTLVPELQIEEFKINPVVFRFLEALRPGAQKTFLPLWQEYIKNEALEIALTMLARQFRFLLLAKMSKVPVPDDFAALAPWQAARLKKQSDYFTPDQLKLALKKLLAIDYDIKSGRSIVNLQTSLELLLLTL